ncbi:MAG: helix-turn-helix domain-containing protein [Ekhidna sp.]|nr:helix-turn-helix domain-containing protein [Ekhidna sp.]
MISDNDVLKLIMGFKVKHLRSKKGISYQLLSKETGLSVSYLNDIEKGKKYPKPDKIRALATAFEVSYDDLVGTKADKKLQPVIELLNSGFFKYFPAEEFGFNMEKLIDFFSNAPDRISAFISTMLKMVRSYQIEKEHFYRVALRSFQDMHDNYFHEIETAASDFRKGLNFGNDIPLLEELVIVLSRDYAITVDEEALSSNEKLSAFRSYFSVERHTLYLNKELSIPQKRFMVAKELGFQVLQLKERSFETRLNKEASFEKLLNNFKASYFGAALLMDAEVLVEDVKELALKTQWDQALIRNLLEKYQVTPETLLQRLTNILPKYFGIDNLFFIRLDGHRGLIDYQITKELHLSGLHQPYQNQITEHLCHRWVSISSIKSLSDRKSYFIDAQVSEYWQTDNAYFCISIAEPSRFDNSNGSSVTLGLSLNESLRGAFNFIKDPELRRRTVHTTCEQCSISDCEHRVAPPSLIEKANQEIELEEELKKL